MIRGHKPSFVLLTPTLCNWVYIKLKKGQTSIMAGLTIGMKTASNFCSSVCSAGSAVVAVRAKATESVSLYVSLKEPSTKWFSINKVVRIMIKLTQKINKLEKQKLWILKNTLSNSNRFVIYNFVQTHRVLCCEAIVFITFVETIV